MATDVRTIKIKDIVADENQPRKYFAADKLNLLKNSIKQHGIITPLVVEEFGSGKFLLVDGERRFRAAGLLDLQEVPAIVEAPKSATERIVRQFNIQEQHEGWTPIEKAIAVSRLSEELGMPLEKICDLLGTTASDRSRYAAFALVMNKTAYVKSEIPLDFAPMFRSINWIAKRLTINQLEKTWTDADSRKMENHLIRLIKEGEITKRPDFTKLKDAFVQDPKLVQKFLEKGATPKELFDEAKVKGAYHLRNMLHAMHYVQTHANQFLRLRDVKLTEENIKNIKNLRATMDKLVDIAE